MPDKELIAAFGYGLSLTGGNKFYYQIFLRPYAPRCYRSPAVNRSTSTRTRRWDRDIAAASRAVATLVGFTFLPKSIPDLRSPSGRATSAQSRRRFTALRISLSGSSRLGSQRTTTGLSLSLSLSLSPSFSAISTHARSVRSVDSKQPRQSA